MRVIGTAGHVDHGKSTLIAALTGVHPDRLKEEQIREMTIDLGFGWLTLASGAEVGLVDVPGHRDFVENMLAGVGGIDAVWLVVAADEGVMQQTREHLAIIDLLGIRSGVVVISKLDLAREAEGLRLLESDIGALTRGTTLDTAATVRVSARTGEGLSNLLSVTTGILNALPPRPNLGKPRLALDRVFTMEGFGTVVTGTLSDGELAVGDAIEVQPGGLVGRVRGLQTHRRQVERAVPGSRTAVNLSGIPAENLHRGDVLTHPRQIKPTHRIDAHVRVLKGASVGLVHNQEAKLFIGTSEGVARVRPLGTEVLLPGQDGWVQLELHAPAVCARGDGFILRLPSPAETIAGGTVIDAHPPDRHRRGDPGVVKTLASLARGNPADLILEAARSAGLVRVRELFARSGLGADAAKAALERLLDSGELVGLPGGSSSGDQDTVVASRASLESIQQQAEKTVEDFHSRFPLRQGMSREELRHRLGLESHEFQALLPWLESNGSVTMREGVVRAAQHTVRFSPDQQAAVDALLAKFAANPGAPPSVRACLEAVGADLFAALRENRTLVTVAEDVVFTGPQYDGMVQTIRSELARRKSMTLAEVRDLFGTSRRYAQALLEHLDRIGVTRRTGDTRVVGTDSAGS